MKTNKELSEENTLRRMTYMRQRSAMIACLENIWNQREDLDLGDIADEIRDILYEVGVSVCIADDVGMDECRCDSCIEGLVDHAEYLRDSYKEAG